MLSLIFLFCLSLLAAAANPTTIISHLKDVPDRHLSRIVGGTLASVGEFPWQIILEKGCIAAWVAENLRASLQQSGRHFCGASLISRNHLISAAHCYSNFVDVVLGAMDYRYGEQVIRASEFKRHPQYNSATIDYDYAVLTLSSAASFTQIVDSIKLVDAGKEYTGTGSISGWGYVEYGAPTPLYLQKVDVIPLVSQTVCQSMWGSRIEITNQMQCVGGDNKVTICMGDSGGPLTVKENGETILIGAASWTENTCQPSLPGAFAKLSAVRSWIDSTVGITLP